MALETELVSLNQRPVHLLVRTEDPEGHGGLWRPHENHPEVCFYDGRWGLRAAVILVIVPPWDLKGAFLIPYEMSWVLSSSPMGTHGCSHPLWELKSAIFIPRGTSSPMGLHRCSLYRPSPHSTSWYSYTPPWNITGYPCGPVVQVTTGVSSSWGYRALSVVSTWTFLTSLGAMLLGCRFKRPT